MRIKSSELNSILKSKGEKNIKRTYYDRLKEAISTGFNFSNDSVVVSKDSIVIDFNEVYFLSHNDLLRIHFKSLYRYIKLWKDRVKYVFSNEDLSVWEESKKNKLKIEFLYVTKNNDYLDYDSTVGSFKFIMDGLTEAGIIIDDSMEYVPLVLSKQKKNNKKNSIKVVITVLKEEDYDKCFSDKFNEFK